MSKDDKVIEYITPADMVDLMNETGMIMVHDSTTQGGHPVVHAAFKTINAQTGEELPGGMPFSVVMYKTPREPGYSNIAIGTVVQVADLGLALPRDYFNFANQRYRFARVYPIDERNFVLQMDMFIHSATREYVKNGFGLWSALFSQILFDLMGRNGEQLHAAAEAFAAARTEIAEQFVATAVASDEPAAAAADVLPETPVDVPSEAVIEASSEPANAVPDVPAVEAAVTPQAAEPVALAEAAAPAAELQGEVKAEAVGEPQAKAAVDEAPAPEAPKPEASVAEPPLTPVAETKVPETV